MLALVVLVALLPLLLAIALMVRLTSRGPVLYTQERVGLDRRIPGLDASNHRRTHDLGGKPFTIYKFRTMRVDAERTSGAVWAAQNDPRITPVGRFLRQYRLDELPQLLNVLRGEMNIVGPRPERPTIFAELRDHITEYPLRQRAKPGITGLAQINHHYDRSGRRPHQGALRPRVHPPPEPLGRPPHHAPDHPRHPLPPGRLVAPPFPAPARAFAPIPTNETGGRIPRPPVDD